MKRLFAYINHFKWFFIGGTLCIMTGTGLDMLNPHLHKLIIDEVIIGRKTGLLNTALLILLAITLSRAVFGYFKEYLFDFGSQRVVERLRRELFDHLQTLSFSFFDGINTGELMARIKEDVDNVFRTLCFGVMLFMEQTIYFVIALALLFALNWKLAIVALLVMPAIAVIAFKLEIEISEVFGKISDQGVKLNTTAQENLAGVRLVKAFGREKYEMSKFLDQNRSNFKLRMKQGMIWRKFFPGIEFLSNLVIALITTCGGYLVIREEISVGTLVAFNGYVMMLIWPMRMLGWLTNMLAECQTSVHKLDALFTEQPGIQNPVCPLIPKRFSGEVVFEGVSFEHHGKLILKDIHLHAKPGGTIAIMGMTGSGKSSLIHLIPRFYECSSGTITLDGIDIKALPLRLLRKQISLVMQDVFLFSDTIAENIQFGSAGVKEEEIDAAIRDAAAEDFLNLLPEGKETVIGERGIGLSGGQKQRLTLARALAKQAPVLILDDATSNLDLETEYRIQQALERRKGMTKFIIAHRISAVKNADEILILENGAIVERGTHYELLAKRGRYFETYCEQFRGVVEENGTGPIGIPAPAICNQKG
jgi:ATP-binding cassette subfamily B multidrug efflux pump